MAAPARAPSGAPPTVVGKRFCATKTQLAIPLLLRRIRCIVTDMEKTRANGRPRKAKTDARSARIAFRVTQDELSQVEAAAKDEELSISDFARTRTTYVFGVRAPKKAKSGPDARAIAELNRVGVNLHQIVRHLNYGGSIPNDLSDAIAEVRAAVAKLAGSDR